VVGWVVGLLGGWGLDVCVRLGGWVALTSREVYRFFVHLRLGMLDVSIELDYGLIIDCLWIAHG
jgi:hypothetical protein